MFESNYVIAHPTSNSNNKLFWTSDNRSNLSTLGDKSQKTGIYAFSSTIKNTLKYFYLNNNNFTNINGLEEFPKIAELELMCNSRLSDIDAISGHTELYALTLHYCSLTNIGYYDDAQKVYSGGLTGCGSLIYLTLKSNSNLNSLVGIEDSILLECLDARYCQLTEISSLKGHTKINYLNLGYNSSLVKVSVLGDLTGLRYIYLNNNTNMDTMEIDESSELIPLTGVDSLNKTYTDSSNVTKTIISQCQGISDIPEKYADLFASSATVLDYSYAKKGRLLSDTDAIWVKLKGRTDVTSLNLDGQTDLSDKSLQDVLSTMTGLKYLGLRNITNLESLDFACTYTVMKDSNGDDLLDSYNCKVCEYQPKLINLIHLDFRGVNVNLTDMTALNGLTRLKAFATDNSQIRFETMQDAINRFEIGMFHSNWLGNGSSNLAGLILATSGVDWDFSNCKKLNKFVSCTYSIDCGAYTDTIDLHACTGIKEVIFSWNKHLLIVPPNVTYVFADGNSNSNLDMQYVTQQYNSSGNKVTLELYLFRPSATELENCITSLKNSVDIYFHDGDGLYKSIDFSNSCIIDYLTTRLG